MHNSASDHNLEASVKAGYEVTDMNTRLIAYFIAGLFFMMFGAVLTILVVLRGFNESRKPLNTEAASALAAHGIQIPPKPHLQQTPVADRVEIVRENTRQIESYGMISEEPGMERAHIPVDEAMKRLAAGEVRYRQEPKPAALEPADPFAEDAL